MNEEVRKRGEAKCGEELGMFKLGSTVVMLVESGKKFRFGVEEGQPIEYGDFVGLVF